MRTPPTVWRAIAVLLALACLICSVVADEAQNDQHIYRVPKSIPRGPHTIFQETFDDESWRTRWALSEKEDYTGEWDVSEGEVTFAMPGDQGLIMMSEARKHAISAKFEKPFDFNGKTLVLQYEFRIQERMICGGAYLKLFPSRFDASVREEGENTENDFEPTLLDNHTPYALMFGPDRCGDVGRVHFIYQHRNELAGTIQEKHVFPAVLAGWLEDSPLTHLYRLEMDTTSGAYTVMVDGVVSRNGTMQEDMNPPIQWPEQIMDPTDVKPVDWVDDAEIDDPEDVKPEGWDVPSEIVDPESYKPLEWDDESDGDWEPAMIPNPNYNGPWSPRRIRNPLFKGIWQPRLIDNPHYYKETNSPQLYSPIGGLGFELWSMQSQFFFNNIILTTDPSEADAFEALWRQKFVAESLIKEEIDWAASPPFYRRWIDNALDFSQENPLLFASMLMTLGLPIVFLAIINSGGGTSKRASASRTSSTSTSPNPSTPSTQDQPNSLVQTLDTSSSAPKQRKPAKD